MKANIRVGLVGFGLAGRVFHAPVISAVAGLELAGVVERNSREAEKHYPGITTYPSLTDMLQDKSIELIVIATPNTSHAPLAAEALRGNRHVVVDKPLAITSAEIVTLMTLAKENDKLLMPFHNRRWDNDFQTVQKLLHQDAMGKIVGFESTYNRFRPQDKPTAWRDAGGPGSGVLLDLGSHLVDQSLVLFGLPELVSAEVRTEREGAKANDAFNIRLHYGKLTVLLEANCLSATPTPRFRIRGTKGGFLKYGLDPQEDALKAKGAIVEPGWGVEPRESSGTLVIDADGNTVSRPIESIPGDYRHYYSGVRDAVANNAPPPVDAMAAWRVTRILEWAEQSSSELRAVPCMWE